MEYLNAFLCGGLLCAVGQIILDRTNLTPARILTGYVVAGVVLQAVGVYQYVVDWGGNVASERSPILRVMPLFIKNIAMKAVFDAVGERKSCLCLSNLGNVQLPEAMAAYVRRMDFIIGVQAAAPHDCGVVTWNGTMYINMIRNIREPELESHFYRVLHTLGLPVKVESNQRWA